MAVVFSSVNQLSVTSDLVFIDANIYYPKIAIFINKNTVYLWNIKDINEEDSWNIKDINEEDSSRNLCMFTFNDVIVGREEQNHILWLLLKSGEIVLIHLMENSKIHVTVDNYKIQKLFMESGNKLVFISESGEFSMCPLTKEEINKQFQDRVTKITTSFLKAPVCHHDAGKTKSDWKGLHIFNEKESVILKCPITDIDGFISLDKSKQYMLPWSDNIVFADKYSMWIISPKDGNQLFLFPNNGMNYHPVDVHNKTLYYITWQEKEIHICCAWSATSVKEKLECEDNSRISSASSSQDALKLQLETQIDMALLENNPTQVNVQLLQSYFEKIEDYMFLIKSASRLVQHSLTYKSILFALQNKIFQLGDKDLLYILTDLIIKVDLLEYIIFKGNKNYESISLYEKNFVELCIAFLSHSDLDLASISWLKYTEIKLVINADDVTNILNAIPYNIKMSSLIMWLKKFVPPLLEENPFFIDHFVRWTVERVFKLEQSGYWPKIGLKFIEEIIAVLEISLKIVAIRPISMDELDSLKDHINYVMELKENFKINMLLSELSSHVPNEVALIMLRRCYTEDLENFLQDYLPSYAARHLFELDDTLRAYVESDAAVSGGGVDGFRLKILLNAFRSTTNKLECLLQVLKVLDVPWNCNVLNLAVTAAASASKDFTVTDTDRTLALEIQNELNYAKIKVILKKYNFPLNCTDYMLVLNKVMSVTTVDLNDLNVICNVTNIRNYGNILYIDRCLRDCEIKTALNYFNDLSKMDNNILLKSTLSKFEQIINSDSCDTTLERNYLDFLKGTILLTDHEIKDIESLYHLKNSYKITITVNELYEEDFCQNKVEDWMKENSNSASSIQKECVTKLMHRNHCYSSDLQNMFRQTPATDSIRIFLESLVLMPSQKMLQPYPPSLSCFKDGRNSKLLIDSLNILINLVFKCDEEYLQKLVGYLSILNALLNCNVMFKHLSVAWKFQYIYLPMSSITGLNNLVNFFEIILSPKPSVTDSYNLVDGYDFIPIKIISNIFNASVTRGDIILKEDFHAIRDKVIRKILLKVISCQELDELLLTCLLVILSRYEGNQKNRLWLLDIIRGQSEVIPQPIKCYLCTPLLRQIFGIDDELSGSTVPYPPQNILKNKFNINLADFALPDNNEETWDVKVVLFCVLKQYPNTDFDRLVELCRTLNIAINDGLTLQLISLLSSWDLKYKLINDDLNCRQIHFENDEKNLLYKCSTIWENIERKDLIREILNDFWKNGEVSLHGRSVSINPYYYEVYLCIYSLLYSSFGEVRNTKEFLLLNFLKNYRRISSPKQYEFELFSVKGIFPEIGYYRLPFHLFMRDDMWSNLKSEITLESYEHWLPVGGLLSLDADSQTATDMICSNALKQTMTSRKRLESNEDELSEPWRLLSKEEPLLRAAHKCVRHIANMEWAGACLFYVLQGCARGADQVSAAQLCYQFAQRWAAVQPGNRAVRKMERLHSSLSTRHALHKIDWACEEFVRLSSEPAQLIRALYLHPSFADKISRYDINRAANEIADKNGINISSIRIQILENILEKNYRENTREKKMTGLNNKELKTAKYILKATCPKMGAIYLSRIAFDDESDHKKCKKLRALQCLMSVVETDTAVKVTNREREALWSSLVELIHIVNLENIDLPWVVATFLQDKCRAIEQLLQVSTNIEGLKIAAELGRKYGSVKIVRDLIPLLLRAGLHEEMTPLLLKMAAPPNEFIYTAWRAVIVTPFQHADHPITERQKVKCINAINLLPVCPVIKDEDLVEIWKNCVRCRCFGVGCLVLPYMTFQTRQSLNEIQKIDKRNLIASLKNLQAETYLISGAMHVIENMSFKGQR